MHDLDGCVTSLALALTASRDSRVAARAHAPDTSRMPQDRRLPGLAPFAAVWFRFATAGFWP
jgi:hypothetical protein